MKKRAILFLSIIMIIVGALVFFHVPKTGEVTNEKLLVVTSFYPLAEFAHQVGGDHVNVINITPAGVEPHDFEPTPQNVTTAYQASLFVLNGGGVDAWASRLIPSLKEKNVTVVEMTPLMGTLLPPAPEGDEEEEEHEEELFDEHFWLDPTLAERQVEAIRDALVRVDPSHADAYYKSTETYLLKLQSLDQAYKDGLASCEIRAVVTSHAAFGYLAKRYGFEQIPITGLSPDEEPSAKALAEVAQIAKSKGVRYVFFETLVSPTLAQTLANEIGAHTLVFNPLEGLTNEEVAAGKNYLSIMQENLANLQTAMVCQ